MLSRRLQLMIFRITLSSRAHKASQPYFSRACLAMDRSAIPQSPQKAPQHLLHRNWEEKKVLGPVTNAWNSVLRVPANQAALILAPRHRKSFSSSKKHGINLFTRTHSITVRNFPWKQQAELNALEKTMAQKDWSLINLFIRSFHIRQVPQ